MHRVLLFTLIVSFGGATALHAQTAAGPTSRQQEQKADSGQPANEQAGSAAGESSSKNTQIDISPPPDDAKDHPESAAAVSDAEEESGANGSQVEEFHPWNPHKAMKDIEVGDFYFRQNNYKAALSRYQEALLYKPNDAVANFRSAQCFEKLNSPQDAVEHYQAYLKVMPHGPLSRDAEKALAKLQGTSAKAPQKSE